MDIETFTSQINTSSSEKEHHFDLTAKFTTSLDVSEIVINLPYQIENASGLKVISFAMIDDGALEPIDMNGADLILTSSLADYIGVKMNSYIGATLNNRQLFPYQHTNVIAITDKGRRSTGGFYPLSLPQHHKRHNFYSRQAIQRFTLGFFNAADTLRTHTTPYTLSVQLVLYSD